MTTLDDRPSERDLELLTAALKPWRKLVKPRCYGLENVPRDGAVLSSATIPCWRSSTCR